MKTAITLAACREAGVAVRSGAARLVAPASEADGRQLIRKTVKKGSTMAHYAAIPRVAD
jgi:hypothetical protein